MKDYSQLFISIAVTATWCAVWFLVITNGLDYPNVLHAAFASVLVWNGYTTFQAVQTAKQKK